MPSRETRKSRTIFAWLLTALWVVGCAGYVSISVDQFADLEPNEWGDFLAGFASPLALFWLVVGYFQQGEELANQVDELKAQSRQTTLLAESASGELEERRNARQPRLSYFGFGASSDDSRPHFDILNSTPTGKIHNVSFLASVDSAYVSEGEEEWDSQVWRMWFPDKRTEFPVCMNISYVDSGNYAETKILQWDGVSIELAELEKWPDELEHFLPVHLEPGKTPPFTE